MVRDPPRKSEQATCRAIQCRAKRGQLSRCREPATCTEWRLRNGRRWQHRFRIHGPQRERIRRLLNAKSSSGGQLRRSRSSRDLMSASQQVTFKNTRQASLMTAEEKELRNWSLDSDCIGNRSFVSKWRVLDGYSGYKICMVSHFANPDFGNFQWVGVRQVDLPGVNLHTCGLRYLSIHSWISEIDLLLLTQASNMLWPQICET